MCERGGGNLGGSQRDWLDSCPPADLCCPQLLEQGQTDWTDRVRVPEGPRANGAGSPRGQDGALHCGKDEPSEHNLNTGRITARKFSVKLRNIWKTENFQTHLFRFSFIQGESGKCHKSSWTSTGTISNMLWASCYANMLHMQSRFAVMRQTRAKRWSKRSTFAADQAELMLLILNMFKQLWLDSSPDK